MSYPPYGQPNPPPDYNPNAQPPNVQPPNPGQGGPSSPYPQPSGYPQQPYPQQPYPQQDGYPQPGGYPPSQPYPQGYPPSQPYPQQGGYPPNYQQGGAPGLPPPQKSGSPVALIVGILAAVIVVTLIGGLLIVGKGGAGPLAALGATATPVGTATPTPLPPTPTAIPAPAGFTTYTAKDGSYSIAYPSDWTPSPANSSLTAVFLSPDLQDYFLTLSFPGLQPTSQYPSLASSFAKGLGATNVKLSPTFTHASLGANTWNKETGTMTYTGQAYTIDILGTDHAGSTFFVLYFAPTATFKSVETTDFTVMTTSVAFKK